MADEISPLLLSIQLETDRLKGQVSTVREQMGNIKDSATNAGGGFAQFGEAVKGVFGKLVALAAAAGALHYLEKAARLAVENQKQMALFEGTLKRVTGATEEQLTVVDKQIRAMSRNAAVTEESVRPAYQKLVTITGSLTEATDLMSISLDVAAGTGKPLALVATLIGKAAEGSVKGLNKLVPGIASATDPLQKLADTFKNAAKEAGDADPYARIQVVMTELRLTIGKALLPAVNALAPAIEELAPTFASLGEPIGALAKAMAPLIILMAKALAPVLTQLIDPLSKLLTGLIPPLTIVFTKFSGPLITLAITFADLLVELLPVLNALLKFGVNTIVNLADLFIGITNAFAGFFKILKNNPALIAGLATAITGLLIPSFVAMIPAIWGNVAAFGALAIALLTNPFTYIVLGIAALVTAIVWLAQNWDMVTKFVTEVWNRFTKLLDYSLKELGRNWQEFWSGVGKFFTALWDKIVRGVIGGVLTIVDYFVGLPGRLLAALGKASTWLYNLGKDIVAGMLNGIKAAWDGVVSWLKSAVSNAVDSVKKWLGIKSPSTVFAGIGKNMGLGMVEGLRGTISAVEGAAMSVASSATVSAQVGVSSAGSSIPNAVSTASAAMAGSPTYNITIPITVSTNATAGDIAAAVSNAIKYNLPYTTASAA
jgi:phage-related protein